MDKISSEISTNGFASSIMIPNEKRVLSDVMPSTKRSGGNYGSLAKSQLQPTFYICHQVETDDTMQRLALKYSVNVQEIKRINKLWSDAEMSLLENVFIPVNASLLSTLRTLYPTLNVVQNPSPTMNSARKTSTHTIVDDKPTSSIRTSDSSASLATTTSYGDYFSKIDQQIRTSKKTLQSFDVPKQPSSSQTNEISSSSSTHLSNGDSTTATDDFNSSPNSRTTIWNNDRHKGIHHLADNSVFVNITTQNQREKHVSAALERIQREKDDFDEL